MLSIIHKYGPQLLLILAVLVVFGNTLGNDFVWDDYHFLVDWDVVHAPLANLEKLLIDDSPLGKGTAYRPMRNVLFSASYALWGEWAMGYQIQALIVYAAEVVLVYSVLQLLGLTKWQSFWASLVFAVHPLKVQSIAWKTGFFDVKAEFFLLWSLYFYLRYKKIQDKRLLTISGLMACASVLVKETGLILPLVLLLYDFMKDKAFDLKRSLQDHRLHWFSVILYISLRLSYAPESVQYERITGDVLSAIALSLTMIGVYIRQIFWPDMQGANQHITGGIRSFYREDVGVSLTIGDLVGLELILGIFFLVLFIFLFLRYRKKLSNEMLFFGAGLICMLPVMQLMPTNALYHDLYAYLILLFVSAGMVLVISRIVKNKWVLLSMGLVVTITLSVLSIRLNRAWASDLALWKYTSDYAPHSAKTQLNLGLAYYREGDVSKAITSLENATKLNPTNPNIAMTLIQAYLTEEMDSKALQLVSDLYAQYPTVQTCQSIRGLFASYEKEKLFEELDFCL